MERIIKPLSKAEAVYLKKLQMRPPDTIFREVESRIKNPQAYLKEPRDEKISVTEDCVWD